MQMALEHIKHMKHIEHIRHIKHINNALTTSNASMIACPDVANRHIKNELQGTIARCLGWPAHHAKTIKQIEHIT